MGFLSLTIFILLASEYLALPQNRGNSGKKPYDVPAGCRIEVKTVYDTVETRKKERTCTDKIKIECETNTEKDCSPREEKLCRTVQELQKVYAIENECSLKDIEICDKILECVGAYCKEKIEVDDPNTCKFSHKENVCEDVKKYRTVKDQKECDPQDPSNDCKTIAKRECQTFTKKGSCRNVPVEDCREIPYEDCKDDYRFVSEQVAKRRPVGICEDGVPYEFSDEEIEEYDFEYLGDYDAPEPKKTIVIDRQIPDCDDNADKTSGGGISFGC